MQLVSDFTQIKDYLSHTRTKNEYFDMVNEITYTNEPVTEIEKRNVITRNLFTTDKQYTEFIVNNMYVKVTHTALYGVQIQVKPLEGYALNIDIAQPFNFFNISHFSYYKINHAYLDGNEVSLCGNFNDIGHRYLLELPNNYARTVIIKFHNKPVSFGTVLNGGYVNNFLTDNYTRRELKQFCRTLRKLKVNDLSLDEAQRILLDNRRGLVLIGDFSNIKGKQYCNTSGDIAIIGQLPHDEDILADLLLCPFEEDKLVFLTDNVAYKMLKSIQSLCKIKGVQNLWGTKFILI